MTCPVLKNNISGRFWGKLLARPDWTLQFCENFVKSPFFKPKFWSKIVGRPKNTKNMASRIQKFLSCPISP